MPDALSQKLGHSFKDQALLKRALTHASADAIVSNERLEFLGDRVLGVVTDLGHVSRHVVESLQACHALFLEANHEPDWVTRSSYPEFLKRRILGDQGHLSNAQAAALLAQVLHENLRTVIAAHLSERNNAPEHAQAALSRVLGCPPHEVPVAHQTDGSDWFDV